MKLAIEEKKLVMWIYCATMLLSMLSIVDNIPIKAVTFNIKYLYIAFAMFMCVYDGILIWNRRATLGIGLLILHTLLYGLVFINPTVADATARHFKETISVYMFTLFTFIYVCKKDCYVLFLEMSYLALALFTTWCGLTHLGNFVNPIYYVNIFSRYGRFRSCFGMGDVNYCGNYCVYLLILSFMVNYEWKKHGKVVKKEIRYLKFFANFIGINMLLSTASRSGIISLALFFLCYGVFTNRQWFYQNRKLVFGLGATLLVIILVVALSTGVMSSIWTQSNREGNFDINYPIFLEYGNILNGMGYIDNSGYLAMVYGYPTTAMDVYYLYIPFSTGILGTCLVLFQMIYLLWHLLRHTEVEGRDFALSMFLMMLYYAIWQVNYMNSRYYTGVIHMVILFYFLRKINGENDFYIFRIKRR